MIRNTRLNHFRDQFCVQHKVATCHLIFLHIKNIFQDACDRVSRLLLYVGCATDRVIRLHLYVGGATDRAIRLHL